MVSLPVWLLGPMILPGVSLVGGEGLCQEGGVSVKGEGDPPIMTSSGSHCSGRYASYWTAFLLFQATNNTVKV